MVEARRREMGRRAAWYSGYPAVREGRSIVLPSLGLKKQHPQPQPDLCPVGQWLLLALSGALVTALQSPHEFNVFVQGKAGFVDVVGHAEDGALLAGGEAVEVALALAFVAPLIAVAGVDTPEIAILLQAEVEGFLPLAIVDAGEFRPVRLFVEYLYFVDGIGG